MADEQLNILVRVRQAGTAALKRVKTGITGIGSSAAMSTGQLRGFYGQLAGVASLLAGGALFGNAVKTFANFDDVMRQVGAVTGATRKEMELLTKTAKKMGQTTRFSAAQSADGLRLLGMAGFEAAEATKALPGVLNLAAAGSVELSTAADIATNVLSAFGLEVEQLGRVNDVLVQTFTSSNTTIQELGESFKMVGPIAKGVGADFEDLFGALGKLGDAGLKGTLAGTALRGALDALLNPTAQEAKLMEQLQKRLGGVALQVKDASGDFIGFQKIIEQLEKAGLRGDEALKLFGLRAGPGMAALLNIGSESLSDLTKKIRESGGVTDKIAEQMESGIGGAMREAAASFEAVKIAIGEAFGEDLIKLIRGARDEFLNLVDTIKRLKEEGTIDLWADATGIAITSLTKIVRGFYWLLVDTVRLTIAFGFATTGNLDAAKAAFNDLGKEAKEYFEKQKEFTGQYYKIEEATGLVIDSTWEYVRALKAAEKEMGADGPIGKGIKELEDAAKDIKIINVPSAKAQIKASLTEIRAAIQTEAAQIELDYAKGLVTLDQYFQEREVIIKRRIAAEVEALRGLSGQTEDVNQKRQIDAQIFALEEQLNQKLIELEGERYRESERLKQNRIRKEEELNGLRSRAERVYQDQKGRIQEEVPGLEGVFAEEMDALKQKHAEERMVLQAFQQEKLAFLESSSASETEINAAREEARRQEAEQTAMQQIELDQLVADQQRRVNELRLKNAKTVTKGMAQLFTDMYELTGKKNKEFFYLAKAAAIAEATINVAQGVTKAIGQGGYYGIVMGALVAASGAVQIAKIANQSLAEGGPVLGTSPTSKSDDKLIAATSGEFMQPVSSVRKLGMDGMEALRRGNFDSSAVRSALGLGGEFSSPKVRYGTSHFQSGGAVNAAPGLENQFGKEEKQTNIVNVLDPAVFDQWSQSSPGQQNILNVISENIFEVRKLVFDNQQG